MMKDITVQPDITIRQAMKTLVKISEKCLVIVDDKNTLLGTLSDGDLRRAILNNISVGDPIKGIYQREPTVLVEGKYKLDEAKKLFVNNKFDLIPVVDKSRKLTDILLWETVFKNGGKTHQQKLDVPVVIMAGGEGTRLEPFTKVLPKPLVPIHEKPVIEHIIERFTDFGINRFILTVNYKARILKAYFEELKSEYSVDFVEENEPLGTAGSLKFLENKLDRPFIVTNCDVIIKLNYSKIYEFHKKNSYDITLLASVKNYIIPYGTCELNGDGHLKQINEKPEFDFLVNVGFYVVNPDILYLIPENKLYHITQLIKDAKKRGNRVGVYPIDDDAWIDVGQWTDYKRAVEKL